MAFLTPSKPVPRSGWVAACSLVPGMDSLMLCLLWSCAVSKHQLL